jgi:hypothetical protein
VSVEGTHRSARLPPRPPLTRARHPAPPTPWRRRLPNDGSRTRCLRRSAPIRWPWTTAPFAVATQGRSRSGCEGHAPCLLPTVVSCLQVSLATKPRELQLVHPPASLLPSEFRGQFNPPPRRATTTREPPDAPWARRVSFSHPRGSFILYRSSHPRGVLHPRGVSSN